MKWLTVRLPAVRCIRRIPPYGELSLQGHRSDAGLAGGDCTFCSDILVAMAAGILQFFFSFPHRSREVLVVRKFD
jgi:hypothetical protein